VAAAEPAGSGSAGWLIVSAGQERGRRFDLQAGDMKIGRSSTCPIRVVGDEEVSREHALIRVTGRRCQLFDLASRNGTYLNGSAVREPRLLQDGDEIELGSSVLTFKKAG
jgi:pSer/pThr/pTyr-binding forkhead associated (FHA) protein